MTTPRFVVIRPILPDAGYRIMLHVDDDGVCRIDHEQVLPERVLVPDAQRVTALQGIELLEDVIEWLIEHLPGALEAVRAV
jgi:hypothetical protein